MAYSILSNADAFYAFLGKIVSARENSFIFQT